VDAVTRQRDGDGRKGLSAGSSRLIAPTGVLR